jgi:glutamate-1-semialdehyde 2,1-aminomutase
MRSHLIREIARSILQVPKPVQDVYAEIMLRKHDDHVASHSNLTNQVLHLLSSSTFLCSYILIFFNFTLAVSIGVIALLLRQFGHAILEPPCHDKEKALLGYNTRNKSLILAVYVLIPIMDLWRAGSLSLDALKLMLPAAAQQWFALTLAVVFGRVLFLAWKHNWRSAAIWFVKLITDPITDVAAYYSSLGRLLPASQERKSEAA